MPMQVHTNGSTVPNVSSQFIIRIGSSMEKIPIYIAITRKKVLFIFSFLHKILYVKSEYTIGCIAIDKRKSIARNGDKMMDNNAAASAIVLYTICFLNSIATSIARIYKQCSTPVRAVLAIGILTIY